MSPTDLPLETLLRAVDGLRAEIAASRAEARADVAGLRNEMRDMTGRAVDRDTHAAQLAALEHRVTALEASRSRVVVSLVYPLVVAVLAAVAAVWLAGKGVR